MHPNVIQCNFCKLKITLVNRFGVQWLKWNYYWMIIYQIFIAIWIYYSMLAWTKFKQYNNQDVINWLKYSGDDVFGLL